MGENIPVKDEDAEIIDRTFKEIYSLINTYKRKRQRMQRLQKQLNQARDEAREARAKLEVNQTHLQNELTMLKRLYKAEDDMAYSMDHQAFIPHDEVESEEGEIEELDEVEDEVDTDAEDFEELEEKVEVDTDG